MTKNQKFKIGICSPINVRNFSKYLEIENPDYLNLGIGGDAVNRLITGLLESGSQIEVFTLDTKVTEPLTINGDNIVIHIFPLREKNKALDIFKKEISYLEEAINKSDINIIHAHWTYEYAIAAIKSNKPHVITVRDYAIKVLINHKDKIYRLLRYFMNEYVLVNSSNLIANSLYIKEYLDKKLNRDIDVIPNPINSINESAYNRTLRENYQIIISVNNGFNKRKNVKNLIYAFSILLNENETFTLRLIGNQFEHNGIAHKWAIKHKLEKNIEFLGTKSNDEVINLLRDSDLLVHPSLEESFGNTLLEAMAQGTPCIGGKDSGAVPWVLDHGKSGILTNVKSPNEIYMAIKRILEDEDEWSRLSIASLENIKNRFMLSVISALHQNKYKQIIYK